MSLLEKIAKIDLTDPTEYVPNQRLTKEEELSLSEMFRSDSWDLLTTKLWPQVLKIIALRALTAKEDQRFYQGMFLGYKQLVDSANQFKGGFDKRVIEELMDNFDDPTGYDFNILH
jgi:hypothetical protein|tara:strand:- start:149 stop:496 length:348 start_codon:yes stop_codon:yes gene_type:complete